MKKLVFLASIILPLLFGKGWGNAMYAQTVTIPDANFAAYLHSIVPSAINGNQLDTSSIVVKTYPDIIITTNLNISDLTGVQYFSSLQQLECPSNSITYIPVLPKSLKSIICDGNRLTSLPALPDSLLYLSCDNNQLTSLPFLPNSITTIMCGDNPYLTGFPALPSSLTLLWCGNCALLTLPSLPDKLKNLDCSLNKLTILPPLPDKLLALGCGNNNLSRLPALPDSLQQLICINNNITCFPPFPTSITFMAIYNNPFNCLPNYVNCMRLEIKAYPLCDLDNINGCPIAQDAPTEIIIPNIFTPNNDNTNDTFLIRGSNLSNFTCKIYDRWGLLVYQWFDINSGWNGKDKSGAVSTDGTYYHVVSYTDNTGKTITKNGFFQLLR